MTWHVRIHRGSPATSAVRPLRWTERLALLVVTASLTCQIQAQDVSGPARASDGDTLNMTGIVVRLHGIDAPELSQTCARAGKPWACGRDAASKLAQLVTGQQVRCEQRDMDDYGRIVATCRAGSIDLSAAMVDAGLAVALSHFSTFYVGNEARAREQRLGIWDSDFQQPAEYRAANPARKSREPSPAIPRQSFTSPSRSTTYYRNCSDARAAGAAPLYRGQPGYRIEMDGDGDGIACEPYGARP